MSWLVTGATGLLGANAMLDLAESASVVGVARRLPPGLSGLGFEADLTDRRERADVVARSGAGAVLHTAAVSSIEACERDPEAARALNVDAAADLAGQAHRANVAFVHVSTDAVFDGHDGGYTESDATSPTNVYGRTKRDAELAVLDAHPGAVVARVNFFGWSPSGTRSLAEYFYGRLSVGTEAPGFQDVVVSTLYVRTLVDRLRRLVDVGASGIVHVVNDEPISKFEFGRGVARAFGFDDSLVTPSSSAAHLAVARGARLNLDTSRLRELLGDLGTDQATGLHDLARDHGHGRPALLAAFSPIERDVT